MQLYDEHQVPLAYAEQGTPGFSWTTRVFFAAYNAMKNRGGSIDSSLMSPTWLRAIDTFTDVGWHKIFIPIGPWRYGKLRPCTRVDWLLMIIGRTYRGPARTRSDGNAARRLPAVYLRHGTTPA